VVEKELKTGEKALVLRGAGASTKREMIDVLRNELKISERLTTPEVKAA
jgi:hypothetical protein